MRALSVAVLVACSSSEQKPELGSAPASSLDRGVFIVTHKTEETRETFEIAKKGDRKVLTTKSKTDDGELETDLDDRPIRASYKRAGARYKLDGQPLVLDITYDKQDSERAVATRPIDIYVAGPGTTAVMTPLCKTTSDVLRTTLGAGYGLFSHHVEAYRGEAVGVLQRVVVDAHGNNLELLCDGDKLVATGVAALGLWSVREGRDADLVALQKAPRPAKKQWKRPIDETQPWWSAQTFVFGNLVVTRDNRTYVERLTTFDIRSHTEVAHREISVDPRDLFWCAATGGKLFCTATRSSFVRSVDPKTLADDFDFAPLLAGYHEISNLAGAFVDVRLDDGSYARLDLASKTAKPSKQPAEFNVGNDLMAECERSSAEAVTVEAKTYVRLDCGRIPTTFAVYYADDEAKSRVASIPKSGKPAWSTVIGTHPGNILTAGGLLVFGTSDQERRLVVVDKKSGAIAWTAKGPTPKP